MEYLAMPPLGSLSSAANMKRLIHLVQLCQRSIRFSPQYNVVLACAPQRQLESDMLVVVVPELCQF